ncbi:MAG: glycosyltransferase [Alphaproteobacteria bacterium]|nr:glycosyltransferase [Alphaproteobacteria bacterium]
MKERPANPKVSYCTTVRGETYEAMLKETLPKNLALEQDNPNVEFIVVDYGGTPDIGQWIQSTFPDEIVSGKLQYVRFEAPHFEMAHSKNMAHRMASGDILCNLDCDNFLAEGHTDWLVKTLTENPRTVVTSVTATMLESIIQKLDAARIKIQRKLDPEAEPKSWLGGRVAMWKEDFIKIGGYDERYSAWCPDDVNIAMRAVETGLRPKFLPSRFHGETITHSHETRVENLSAEDREHSAALLQKNVEEIGPTWEQRFKNFGKELELRRRKPAPYANLEGNVGCGDVVNSDDVTTTIAPLIYEERGLTQEHVDQIHSQQKYRAHAERPIGIRT